MSLDLGVVTGSLSPAGGGLFQCMRVPTNLGAQRGARVSVYGLVDDRFEQARSAGGPVNALMERMARCAVNPQSPARAMSGTARVSAEARDWAAYRREAVVTARDFLDDWFVGGR
jgi:hypothetical protein